MLLPLLQNNVLGGNVAPVFTGPSIADFSLALNVAMSPRSYVARFTEYTSQALTFTEIGVFPTGLSLSVAGELTGTPTVAGVFGPLQIRATDPDPLTADSNEFYITVSVGGGTGDIGGEFVGGDYIGYDDLGNDEINTPLGWLD